MVLERSLHLCALDKSSLSIGWLKFLYIVADIRKYLNEWYINISITIFVLEKKLQESNIPFIFFELPDLIGKVVKLAGYCWHKNVRVVFELPLLSL